MMMTVLWEGLGGHIVLLLSWRWLEIEVRWFRDGAVAGDEHWQNSERDFGDSSLDGRLLMRRNEAESDVWHRILGE